MAAVWETGQPLFYLVILAEVIFTFADTARLALGTPAKAGAVLIFSDFFLIAYHPKLRLLRRA